MRLRMEVKQPITMIMQIFVFDHFVLTVSKLFPHFEHLQIHNEEGKNTWN